MLLEKQALMERKTDLEENVNVIILLNKNPSFVGVNRPFDLEICGKKMWKYVELAASAYRVKTTIITPETNIFQVVKPMLTGSRWTLILYSDTPLIQKSTIEEIIDYAQTKGISALKLARGYIFDTQYLKQADGMASENICHFGTEDFMVAFDARQLEFITQIMKSRIIEFHQHNGVIIMDNNTTFIDADVVIESGVIIHPFNVIKGNSIISRSTTLKSGNIIENSIVAEGCTLLGASLLNAKISAGKTVGAFEKIEG